MESSDQSDRPFALCGIGIGTGQPFQEFLHFDIPEAPLMSISFDFIPGNVGAKFFELVRERFAGGKQEVGGSARCVDLRESLPLFFDGFGEIMKNAFAAGRSGKAIAAAHIGELLGNNFNTG